jgi:hypothetical protein
MAKVLSREMARHPRPGNIGNALRLLREVLSDRGPRYPISQEELASIIDVPVSTVRSVECGRRKLSDGLLVNVVIATGAEWHEEKKCWVVCSPSAEVSEEPFSLPFYKDFVKQRERRPRNAYFKQAKLQHVIATIFCMIPESRWWDLYLRFRGFIFDLDEEFDLAGLIKLYFSSDEAHRPSLESSKEYQAKLAAAGRQKEPWKRPRPAHRPRRGEHFKTLP